MNRSRLISAVQWTARVLLAGVLMAAGILKLQDNSSLIETVAYITWLPVRIKWWIVNLLPWGEIVLAVLLISRLMDRVVVPVVALLFFGFLVFAIYGTATGMEGDCGCFGEWMDSSFGAPMIIRNAVLTAMAGILFWRPETTALSRQTSV